MKSFTGIERDIILLRYFYSLGLKKLPLSLRWYSLRIFKNEKLTQYNGQYVINTLMPLLPSLAFTRLQQHNISIFNRRGSPYSINIALTYKCPFNCWHCSKAYRQGEELSTKKWIEIIKEIQNFGICIIGFSGGEPMQRPDLEEIIAAIDKRSCSLLFTSGDGLYQERAKRLKEAGLTYVSISLDHYDEKEHNRLRGSDIAFSSALQAIKVSRANGFYTALHLTVPKDCAKLDFLYRYLDFVRSLDVQEIRITEPLPCGNLTWEKADIFLNEEHRRLLKDFHIQVNKERRGPKVAAYAYLEDEKLFGCGGGIRHIYLDPFGNLYPCDFIPISFGNICQEKFETVFQRLRSKFDKPCRKCFLLKNIDQLRLWLAKGYPLEYQKNSQIFDFCSSEGLPDYYKKLGWK